MATSRDEFVGEALFFQKTNLEKAWEKLELTNVLVISGAPGSGKTELAHQLLKKFEKKYHSKQLVDFKFICGNHKQSIVAQIREFASCKNWPASAFQTESLDEVLKEFFKHMNRSYPNSCKFFIFDDAVLPTQLLVYLERQIYEPLLGWRENDFRKESWRVVVTTGNSTNEWTAACDRLNTNEFLHVDGFTFNEMVSYVRSCEGAHTLTDADFREIDENVGRRPLALRLLRGELENELRLMPNRDPRRILRDFVDGIDKYGLESKDEATSLRSVRRLIEQEKDQGDNFKRLIVLITMFNAKNFTNELLVSAAEVTLQSHDSHRNLARAAYKLQRDMVVALSNRFLCDRKNEFPGTYTISISKLVQQSLITLRKEDQNALDVMVGEALVALTRVIPRDGRGLQSHVINGYMYNHACSLLEEVKPLVHSSVVDRERTPCILLLMSNLCLSMAYCQLALRSPRETAQRHINEALDWFSQLFVDREYRKFDVGNQNMPKHVHYAEFLYEKCVGDRSILYTNNDYAQLVQTTPLFLRLTNRDKQIMFGGERSLDNDHLDEKSLSELRYKKKALKDDQLKKIYAAELLAEIYSLGAKALGFHRDAHVTNECLEFAEAARCLYQRIKREFQVTLLAELITEREFLKIQLNSADLDADNAQKIADCWEELAQRKDKAYEYGLMRADLEEDPYHEFLCEEGLARSLGRACALDFNEDRFSHAETLFLSVINTTSKKDPKLQMNALTTSKAYQNYAEFLSRCNKPAEAVKAVLDAFINLNSFLCEKNKTDKFPEHDEKCGKAKPLYRKLSDYVDQYRRDPSGDCLLEDDELNRKRRQYAVSFVRSWHQLRPSHDRDNVKAMEQVLQLSNMSHLRPIPEMAMEVEQP